MNLQAACIISAAFSLNLVEPTLGPDAPAIKKEGTGLPTFPFLKDGMKSGMQDKTPCNEESICNRITFK